MVAVQHALGNSEGLLAAAALWAVVAHLDGHRRAALALGTAAALLRPEVWPFLGLYGLWLWRAEPGARAGGGRRRRAWCRCCGSGRTCSGSAAR